MSKGMTDAQKNRLRNYLDGFNGKKRTCLLCNKKPTEFYHTPQQTDSQGVPLPFVHLHVYGLCEGHADLVESDALAEAKVEELKAGYTETAEIENLRLMTVVFDKPDHEEVKYAA